VNPISTGFACPCHGSQYDLNGTVTVGPATVGSTLQHYEVSESTPGGVLVIDPTRPVSATTRLT
jgi:Rieske Fe-S protein